MVVTFTGCTTCGRVFFVCASALITSHLMRISTSSIVLYVTIAIGLVVTSMYKKEEREREKDYIILFTSSAFFSKLYSMHISNCSFKFTQSEI